MHEVYVAQYEGKEDVIVPSPDVPAETVSRLVLYILMLISLSG